MIYTDQRFRFHCFLGGLAGSGASWLWSPLENFGLHSSKANNCTSLFSDGVNYTTQSTPSRDNNYDIDKYFKLAFCTLAKIN